ncbi:MAG: protein kinase [Gemmataceae bacterium]|nr:protein kinase [Gemmataceae bacterium]MDW8265593.1 protein kinase [Gemmataceae bacterium]
MSIDSVAELVRVLQEYRLLGEEQLNQLSRTMAPRFTDPRSLARELIQRGWLTPYQINQIFLGHASGLVLGAYVLLERLGEGGMGNVFKARHQRLDRIVALKLMRKEHVNNPLAVRRFRREIQAAAQLSHPNIVTAFDADEVNGIHFFVMEYVDGIDLGRLVKETGRLPVAMACDFIRQAALGLQHAYERGMVHRDIKPANLLVAGVKGPVSGTIKGPDLQDWAALQPTVKILDMGLARLVCANDSGESTQLTQDGRVVGTPDFMAPEQARNSHTIDIRADLYSLGCTFYYLLAGQVPFPGGTGMEKLFRHQTDEPTPIENLRPEIPPALGGILRRMMAKQPEQRYQTPAEVAEALTSLAAEPVGPPVNSDSPTTQTHLNQLAIVPPADDWLHRRRSADQAQRRRVMWAMLIGTTTLGLFVVMLALLASLSERWQPTVPGPRPTEMVEERPVLPPTASPLDRLDARNIPPAERVTGQPRELVAVLGEHRGHHWTTVRALVFLNPDTILSTSQDGVIRWWEVPSLREKNASFRRADAVAVASDGQLAAFSLTGEQRIVLWDIGRQQKRNTIDTPRHRVTRVALSPDGSLIAYATESPALAASSMIHVQSPGRDVGSMSFQGPRGVASLVISPDGKLVAVSGADQSMKIWSVHEGRERMSIAGRYDWPWPLVLAFSPDSRLLAAGGRDQTVRLYDVALGRELTRLSGHTGAISALAFTPDGQTLVSGCHGGLLVFWDVREWTEQWTARVAPQEITALAFAPDGKMLVSAGRDGLLRLWDVPGQRELGSDRPPQTPVSSLAFASDGKSLAALRLERDRHGGSSAHVWDIPSFREHSFIRNQRLVTALTFSPDGRRLVWSRMEGGPFFHSQSHLTTWNLATNKEEVVLKGPLSGMVSALAYSPDGKTVAAGGLDGSIRLWNAVTGQELATKWVGEPMRRGAVSHLAFVGNQWLLSQYLGGRILVWNRNESSPPQELRGHWIGSLAVSPDGRTFAGLLREREDVAFDRVVALGYLDQQKPRPLPLGNRTPANAVSWSPNGKTLALALADGRILLWDIESNRRMQEINLPGPAMSLAYAADGRHLATGNANGTVYILRLAPP